MKRIIQVLAIILGMHTIGTAILFGCVSGPACLLATPILALFGWFFVIPEAIGVGLQWFFYGPSPTRSLLSFSAYAAASTLAGALVAAPLIPKEQGNEMVYWIAGLLAGGVAALFSFLCIHEIMVQESQTPNIPAHTTSETAAESSAHDG